MLRFAPASTTTTTTSSSTTTMMITTGKRIFLPSSSSSSASTLSSIIPNFIQSKRTFIIPKQLKAYGSDFVGSRGDVRAAHLTPHNELMSLKSISVRNTRYPTTTTDVAENVESFEEMHLPQEVTNAIAEMGVSVPSPVQQQAIPAVLAAGESNSRVGSMIIAGPHGSGKTFAYLAPLFARLMKDRDVYNIPLRENRPRAIIFAPTRELIWQIHNACETFDKHTGLKSLAFTSTKRNHRKWKTMMKNTMPDVLILGPSFALRAIENHRLFLDDLRCVVMDEADELISHTSSRLGQRFLQKVINRLCYRHLWNVNTQTLFVTSGVTRELGGYIAAKHGQAVPAVVAGGMHLPVKSSRHKFIPVQKEGVKLDILRRVLQRAGFEPSSVTGSVNDVLMNAQQQQHDVWSSAETGNLDSTVVRTDKREEDFLRKLRQEIAKETGSKNERETDNIKSNNNPATKELQLLEGDENNIINTNDDNNNIQNETMNQDVDEDSIQNLFLEKRQQYLEQLSPQQQEELQDELKDYDFFDYFLQNGKHPSTKGSHNVHHNKFSKMRDVVVRWEHQETRPAPFLNPHENQNSGKDDILNPEGNKKAIIFFKNIDRCTALYHRLRSLGYPVAIMHASLPTAVRDEFYRKWVSGELPILCATDLVSRGLDVNVSCVINFDMPTDAKPYLNRAGRTARMGRPGAIVSLFTKKQEVIVDAIKQFLKHNLPLEGIHNLAPIMQKPTYSQFRHLRRNKLARKFVSLISKKTIPFHLEKTYVKHNAMWRPLFRPKTVAEHGGVPVRQQNRIMAEVRDHAMWHRRIVLAQRKGGGAKFGRNKANHLRGGHKSEGGLKTVGTADPQTMISMFSDKYARNSYAGIPQPPK